MATNVVLGRNRSPCAQGFLYLIPVTTLFALSRKPQVRQLTTTRLLGWAALLVGPVFAWGQQPRSTGPRATVGKWSLCATQWIDSSKKSTRSFRTDTTILTANVCTEVVFQANGTGYAGLANGKQYAFTWRQQQAALTLTYLGSPSSTRLREGAYKVKLVAIPPQRQQPPFLQLELSTLQGETHLLRRTIP
jgi:hypothetical protein